MDKLNFSAKIQSLSQYSLYINTKLSSMNENILSDDSDFINKQKENLVNALSDLNEGIAYLGQLNEILKSYSDNLD